MCCWSALLTAAKPATGEQTCQAMHVCAAPAAAGVPPPLPCMHVPHPSRYASPGRRSWVCVLSLTQLAAASRHARSPSPAPMCTGWMSAWPDLRWQRQEAAKSGARGIRLPAPPAPLPHLQLDAFDVQGRHHVEGDDALHQVAGLVGGAIEDHENTVFGGTPLVAHVYEVGFQGVASAQTPGECCPGGGQPASPRGLL